MCAGAGGRGVHGRGRVAGGPRRGRSVQGRRRRGRARSGRDGGPPSLRRAGLRFPHARSRAHAPGACTPRVFTPCPPRKAGTGWVELAPAQETARARNHALRISVRTAARNGVDPGWVGPPLAPVGVLCARLSTWVGVRPCPKPPLSRARTPPKDTLAAPACSRTQKTSARTFLWYARAAIPRLLLGDAARAGSLARRAADAAARSILERCVRRRQGERSQGEKNRGMGTGGSLRRASSSALFLVLSQTDAAPPPDPHPTHHRRPGGSTFNVWRGRGKRAKRRRALSLAHAHAFFPLSRDCPPQLEAIKRDRAAAAAAAQSPLQAIQATAETTPQGTAPQVGERREEKEKKKRKKREARARAAGCPQPRSALSFIPSLSPHTHQTRLTVAQRIGLAG